MTEASTQGVYHGHSKGEKWKHKLTKSMSINFKMSETRPENGEWACYHSESAPASCNLSWTKTVFHFKGMQISFSLNSPHHTRQNSPPRYLNTSFYHIDHSRFLSSNSLHKKKKKCWSKPCSLWFCIMYECLSMIYLNLLIQSAILLRTTRVWYTITEYQREREAITQMID